MQIEGESGRGDAALLCNYLMSSWFLTTAALVAPSRAGVTSATASFEVSTATACTTVAASSSPIAAEGG
jgi:hypothetical protein